MGILLAYLLGILTALKPKQQGSGNHEQTSKSHSPLAVTLLPRSLSDEELTKIKKKEVRENKKYLIDKWTLIVLCIYAGFTIAIWWQTRTANQLAYDSREAQLRPWIGIDGEPENVKGHGVYGASFETVSSDFTLKFRNYGQSPARRFALEFADPDFIKHSFDQLSREACDKADATFNGRPNGYATTIFPGNPYSQLVPGRRGVHYVGCVAYIGSQLRPRPYHTWFIYSVHSFVATPDHPGEHPGDIGGTHLYLDDSDAE
jgi:hypothetical protein